MISDVSARRPRRGAVKPVWRVGNAPRKDSDQASGKKDDMNIMAAR
jgi:hypothetical protein